MAFIVNHFECQCAICGQKLVIDKPTKPRTFTAQLNKFKRGHVWKCEMDAAVKAKRAEISGIVCNAIDRAREVV
ncbi:MAG: hypothetical protein U5L02_06310 [Rheinheimera sp.]|nr:hypothetical protein [Rheinheimera sp.]